MLTDSAVECGAITSIAISADHSAIAGGHANGTIFIWDTTRLARPFLHIPHLDPVRVENRSADGHVPNSAVCHLGFLGARRTALVSANVHGMAFSHLATRGTGALGRIVKTTRILGRYPNDAPPTGKPRKPSTVLAFAPLPLGNVERGTDDLGLTAMLTPYLLVIVSTTPIAQTQHKAARPKEVTVHGAMSGCLAWFPAVKLKVRDPKTGDTISKVKLVYCWSNVLTVMDIEEIEASDNDKPRSLLFKPRSRWKSEEAIVSIQWLSRSVLCALTITQRLIILEDQSMRMTEAFDMIQKHIFHQDLFTKQLHNLVEQLDEDDTSMHGVVADAFYMSFKTYKGKMFLLGFNDVSVGTLSNWADRLIALMEDGDYIGAIHLATSYYTGDADKLTVGLPEDTRLRHEMVQDKLVEIMTASLKFAFNKNHKASERNVETSQLRDLADACFVACLSIDDTNFLFDEAYEWYEENNLEGIFLESLEPNILNKQISSVPSAIAKALVTYYVNKGWQGRLEELICHMETTTMDIDQITLLCKQHNLYDALIYVWSQSFHDYITPLIDLLTLLISVQNSNYFSNTDAMNDPMHEINAVKIFPYLSHTLTGRIYPTGEGLGDGEASKAKAELYWFLFSGKTIIWPKGSTTKFLTKPGKPEEPPFPYLCMILKFDAPSFLSALNEAFEDSFLNDGPDQAMNGGESQNLSEEQVFGLSVNRQYIVSILLEVMNRVEFPPEHTIYLDMFIARNVPKFPQYLILSGSSLDRVLAGLCNYPSEDIADDAQLSAEYLLSVYHPADLSSLIPLFHQARFYRVLKSIYKTDKQFASLMQAYFDDQEDREAVFNCIADCLRPRTGLNKRQILEVHAVIRAHAVDLVLLDPIQAALSIDTYAPILHPDILGSLSGDPEHEYVYLKTILEPTDQTGEETKFSLSQNFVERYVQLLCKFSPSHVVDFVGMLQATDLRLDKVLPTMEENGVVDAEVVLMAREGLAKEAMERLIRHLGALEATFLAVLEASAENMEYTQREMAAEDSLEALHKYTNVGIWLCKSQTKSTIRRFPGTQKQKRTSSRTELLPDEALWLNLIDATVQITKSISGCIASLENTDSSRTETSPAIKLNYTKFLSTLRTLVQRTFTALLSLTSTSSAIGTNLSFVRILSAFLTRASISSPSLSDLRSVLSSIFSAYTYEENILSLANRLLEKELFINVQSATELRQRGWRPRGNVCEGCRKRVWGPGAISDIFKKWEEKQARETAVKLERRVRTSAERDKGRAMTQVDIKGEADPGNLVMGKGKGKGGRDSPPAAFEQNTTVRTESQDKELGPLIVLACRHIYHQSCLEAVQIEDQSGDIVQGGEFRCPIDG
jgi:vacuolar protein sorting-associated protein 8